MTDASTLPARVRWQRALAALGRVLADPEQTEQVLVFSMYANAGSMPDRLHAFFDDVRGQRLYAEHRLIDSRSVDLDALGALPENTLGWAYAHFLRSRGLSPDVFAARPPEIADPRAAYVIQRLRQTHDLWHVVTGYETDPASEVALQAFTFAQVRAPSALILAVLGTLHGTLQGSFGVRACASLLRRTQSDQFASRSVEACAVAGTSSARGIDARPEAPEPAHIDRPSVSPKTSFGVRSFASLRRRTPRDQLASVTRVRPRLVLEVLSAARTGRRAEKLATVAWEDHWATPLADVRAMLRLPVEPRLRT